MANTRKTKRPVNDIVDELADRLRDSMLELGGDISNPKDITSFLSGIKLNEKIMAAIKDEEHGFED